MGDICLGRDKGCRMTLNPIAGETVLVAGAGIAGLGAALALSDGTRRVTILDRDPPPPDASPEEAFRTWERRGATQLRHSHAFLGRLTTLIRKRYPQLMEELVAAGARLFTYEDGLPPALREHYVQEPGDTDMAFLFSRRTTLELIMRRYASRLPGAMFVTDAGVRGLISRRDGDVLRVEGLQVEQAGSVTDMRADIVVDASGRNTLFPDWLRAGGVTIAEEESPAGILYFTRHYRLKDGVEEPSRDGPPGAGDLGYIKYGVFVADNRHFSVTLALPEIETELRMAVMKPEVFDAICAAIPGCGRWTETSVAEPASPVYAMGNLVSTWRTTVKDGKPQVLNFFAIGDAAVRTNPLYGRGCSAGVVHAHILKDALDATRDPVARALLVETNTRNALRSYYDTMVKQDQQSIRRARNERDPSYKPKLRARIVKSFVEDAVTPAARGDIAVSRASSRAFHMIDDPVAWLKNPVILARILRMWTMPAAQKRIRGLYPPVLGPKRPEMLSRLGLVGQS
jgi:2-polyprenyl-6-methoxyphenol hydroxylase-like FAD-dependent oxidoreductase